LNPKVKSGAPDQPSVPDINRSGGKNQTATRVFPVIRRTLWLPAHVNQYKSDQDNSYLAIFGRSLWCIVWGKLVQSKIKGLKFLICALDLIIGDPIGIRTHVTGVRDC
jgi:hypothetical protein